MRYGECKLLWVLKNKIARNYFTNHLTTSGPRSWGILSTPTQPQGPVYVISAGKPSLTHPLAKNNRWVELHNNLEREYAFLGATLERTP